MHITECVYVTQCGTNEKMSALEINVAICLRNEFFCSQKSLNFYHYAYDFYFFCVIRLGAITHLSRYIHVVGKERSAS